MLEKLIFISFLSLILTHNFADLRNFRKQPPMPKDIIELKESSQTQNNKSSEGLENNFQIDGREIPTDYGIYIVDNYQKFTISGFNVYYDISQKFYRVCSPNTYNFDYYIYIDGKPLGLTANEVSIQGKGQVNALMDDQKTYIKLVGYFYNGDIITIRYTYYYNLNYRFFIQFPLIVYNYYGICKLSLEVDDDFSILGTMNGTLPLVNKKIYYENACPEESFFDYAIVSPYAVRWNSYFSTNAVSNSYNQYLELIFPRTALGGNNFIMENKIETNFVDYIDNNYVKSNITHYIFTYPGLTKGKVNTKISVDFINSVDNEILYPLDESLIVNTSTVNTRRKAAEILAADDSDEPDYIKLGRWVFKNMKYGSASTDLTVDEILSSLTGYCWHYTKLYNSLLFSIGIKAVFITGFFIPGKNLKPESATESYHTWTIAKIGDKWEALDSTKGLFFGNLPTSHIFGSYYDFSYGYRYSSNIEVGDIAYDTKFQNIVTNSSLISLKEAKEEAIYLREEKVKQDEERLKNKENELNSKEKTLNETKISLDNFYIRLLDWQKELQDIEYNQTLKEKELDDKEKNLTNFESELENKNEELLKKDRELNLTEISLIKKKEEMNEKEKILNSTEQGLIIREIELKEFNSTLHIKEKALNNERIELDRKEKTLEEKNITLIGIEEELNKKNSSLNTKEQELFNRKEDLDKRESNLLPKENELNEKEESLNKTEIELKEKEENLNKTKIELNKKEENLNKTKIELNKKEENLNKIEIKLNEKEESLNKIEIELNEKEENLNKTEIELNEKEVNLTTKENELNQKQNSLDNKEITLNEKGESNLAGLIVVCILLGISIIFNLFLFLKLKRGKGISNVSTTDKMTELI